MLIVEEPKTTTAGWESSEDSGTAIDAYDNVDVRELQPNESYDGMKARLECELSSHLELLAIWSDRIAGQLAAHGFLASKVFVHPQTPRFYELLIVVRDRDFFSPDFLKMYSFARAARHSARDQGLSLLVGFVGAAEDLNEVAILSDGYKFSRILEA